jgi:zinc D-Ala-D-Ala carboxypeptidase
VTHRGPARTTTRRIRIRRTRVASLLIVIAAIATALGYQSASSSSTATTPPDGLRGEHGSAPDVHRGVLGEADGAVPDGATIFDDEIAGVANLDPALLGALRQAATDAADEGVEFLVDSAWRSPEYQNQLLREAVSEYGSEAEAARWVATPQTSAHVSGDAVDIGSEGAEWLSEHGAELRLEAIDQGCPPMYADPTEDPRMQR